MRFLKMHGLGNDFVILDQRDVIKTLAPAQIKHICDRNKGVGCDQLIIMEPSKKADLFMRIYNPDGSEAESCGNATRCVADRYMQEKKASTCTIETLGGVLPCRQVGDLVEVDMGAPMDVREAEFGAPLAEFSSWFGGKRMPLVHAMPSKQATSVNMGNPHCVFFVQNAEEVPLETLGPKYENDPAFPRRTNVEFAHIMPDGNIRLRVWERGAGITLACGSGACATIVAAVTRGLTGRRAKIRMDGGELSLEWRESDGHVLMAGPVAYVFEGTLS